MLGLIVTGGIGINVKIIHSGLAKSGFTPKNLTSSSLIFSSLALTSIGLNLTSFSIKVVGFSTLTLNCFASQCGHFLTILK